MLVLASQHHSPKQNSFLETIKIDSTYKPDFCRSNMVATPSLLASYID